MAMTFLNQQSMLSRLLGDSNTGATDQWPLADRKFELNRGELQFAVDSKSLLGYATGTISSQQIAIPSDYLSTHVLIADDVVLTNAQEMGLADWERFKDSGDDRYYFWVDASDVRYINFIDSNTNGQTYRWYYFRKPTVTLSADGDESVLQDEYRKGSVYYAASELLDQVGKSQLSDLNRAKYIALAGQARAETEQHILTIHKAIPDTVESQVYDKDIQGIGEQPGGVSW